MKVIETQFNGHFFRSRLEARWACFFYHAGIQYEYEPEGFKSDKGDMYLPDFYLPNTFLRGHTNINGVYIEIKPNNFMLDGKNYRIKASDWFDKPLILFLGQPHEHSNIYGNITEADSGYECWSGHWDNYMGLWKCPNCGTSKIEFMEGNYNYCPECDTKNVTNHFLNYAASVAKMERF